MFPDNFVVNCMKVLFLSDWPNPSLVNLDCKLEIFRLESTWYLISCRYCTGSLTTFESDINWDIDAFFCTVLCTPLYVLSSAKPGNVETCPSTRFLVGQLRILVFEGNSNSVKHLCPR